MKQPNEATTPEVQSAKSAMYEIVLVEDNLADVFLVKQALRENGIRFNLTHLRNGEEAVSALTAGDAVLPDLILLDLSMPKLDGLAVLATIRNQPNLATTPVIVMSSVRSPKQDALERLGVSSFLTKPSRLNEFIREVGAAVKEILYRPQVVLNKRPNER